MRATLAAREDKVAGAVPVRVTESAAAGVITRRRFDRAVQEPEPPPVMRGHPEARAGGQEGPEAVAPDTRADLRPAARPLLDLARRPVDLVSPLPGSLLAVGGKPA
ncbi:MAG: hypothetical protein DME17_02595 [Candidatus Rokuibacteriota bacterium]|nr:MAG: hypothetical protein DME17_02595 [Candidatus Rokubacteria bacterium]